MKFLNSNAAPDLLSLEIEKVKLGIIEGGEDCLKLCPDCQCLKSITEFHSKAGRREPRCKICSNKKRKERRQKNKLKEKRKKTKNQTLRLTDTEIIGNPDSDSIEAFGKSYGNLIQELLK